MGLSTDALLWYGYCWNEEADLFDKGEDGDREWVDVWIERKGIPVPAEWSVEWYQQKEEIAKQAGALVESHCSRDYPEPLVAVAGTFTRAWRGQPRSITALEVDPAWDATLDEFCRVMGITPPDGQKPGWWLASDMG